jgi:cytochrome c oxidase subunit II
MVTIFIILSVILLAVIAVQVGRLTEITASMRSAEEVQDDRNRLHAILGMIFMTAFMLFCVVLSIYYWNSCYMAPGNIAASEHGPWIDKIFYITLVPTGIVFILCHVALFWFGYKYSGKTGQKVLYIPHDNRLEIIWTAIPAFVMTILVIGGLWTWNIVMADVPENAVPGKDYVEIEATGSQFQWTIRHPGKDNLLGTKYFRNITTNNFLGQDWTDTKNHDDVIVQDEIVLPVNRTVRVRITARDVLHNFYLPQFRLKMDAVPGMPTYFVFKPTMTTEQYRKQLSTVPEWQELNADNKPRWRVFEYELACAEMCGQGHFSMRRVVKVVSEKEYEEWVTKQKAAYTAIKGTEEDTYGKTPAAPAVIEEHKGESGDATKAETKPISIK